MGTRLGQNFLTNSAVIDFIIEDIKKNANLSLPTFEIGPGKCALTKELVKIQPNLKVFEKDEKLKEYLKKCVKEENIIMGDFLQANITLHTKGENFNAIGNLPYYITSPILRKLVGVEEKNGKNNSSKKKASGILKYGIFMVQKEVGEKIKTTAKNKSMLRFLLNLNHQISYLKTIPASDFSPPPKVESCLVRFEWHGQNQDINSQRLFNLLSLITPLKKKSLGKISKILEGKIQVPEHLKNKRIHQLTYKQIKQIILN